MAQDLFIGAWSLTQTRARRNGTKSNPQGAPRDGFLLEILQTHDPSHQYRQVVRLESLEIQVVELSQLRQLPALVVVLILPAAIEEEHAALGASGPRANLNPLFDQTYSSGNY